MKKELTPQEWMADVLEYERTHEIAGCGEQFAMPETEGKTQCLGLTPLDPFIEPEMKVNITVRGTDPFINQIS